MNSPATNSFSEKALQVQRTLQSSLTLSLRKEAEIKNKWQASPGEVFSINRLSKASSVSALPTSDTTSFSTVPRKIDFSALDMSEEKTEKDRIEKSSKFSNVVTPSQLKGPNVCLSDQFPSGLSPIKPHADELTDKSSLLELSQDSNVLNEDPSTKKLLEFIQKLEKGPVTDVTLAERMNQLSFLLKNSSMNSGFKSETEDIAGHKLLASTQRSNKPQKHLGKELIFTQSTADKATGQNKAQFSTKPYVSKCSESKYLPTTDQSTKAKGKSDTNPALAANHKSVHVSFYSIFLCIHYNSIKLLLILDKNGTAVEFTKLFFWIHSTFLSN